MFKTVKLSTSIYCNYDFLEDDMYYKLNEILLDRYGIVKHDFKLGYSLDYCQGDGVCFLDSKVSKENIKKILKKMGYDLRKLNGKEIEGNIIQNSNHYFHENTFKFEHDIKDNDGNYTSCNHINNIINEQLKEICIELKNYGYEIIKYKQIGSICFHGFLEFIKINNIEIYNNLNDFIHCRNKKEVENITGLIHCCTSGNTGIDGLRVKLPELYEHEKETRVFVDGKTQSKAIIKKFYNFTKK